MEQNQTLISDSYHKLKAIYVKLYHLHTKGLKETLVQINWQYFWEYRVQGVQFSNVLFPKEEIQQEYITAIWNLLQQHGVQTCL